VELLTAILFVIVARQFGVSWYTLKFCVFCFLLLGLIFMDAETGLLPAEFTYTGIVLGLASSWVAPVGSEATKFLLALWNAGTALSAKQLSLLDAVMASLFGAAFFYLFWAVYYLVRHRSGMGFGDFALASMCGAFLGLKLVLFALFVAPLLGTVISLLWLAASRRSGAPEPPDTQQRGSILLRQVPFGVYLGVSALLALFFGERAWGAYLAWFA
jgi:leader peptidase (prepilin peptidase)/N-methyltransferase